MTVLDKNGENINKGMPRIDGWTNLWSSVGKRGRDKTDANTFTSGPYDYFTDDFLTEIYGYEGLGASIIDIPADDMTKAGFIIENDENGEIQVELKKLKVNNHINEAIKWSRLYRGSVIVMFFEGDTSALDQPMPKTIKGIKSLRVYSAARIRISTSDIVTDVNSPYFDEVEIFPIRTRSGTIMHVHESRCLVFKGKVAPDYETNLEFDYRYWGYPIMIGVYERLSNYGITEKGIATMMQEASIGKYKLKNLANFLAQNTNESIAKVYNRIDIIDRSKSILNAVLLDADGGEDYVRETLTFAGIDGIIDRFMMNLSAVCHIPVTLLFGRSPAGMNATGESDFENYYNRIESFQENWLIYPLTKLINIISNYIGITDPKIKFNPLRRATEKEAAQIRKLNTESDQIDMEIGLYTPEEVLQRREIRGDD